MLLRCASILAMVVILTLTGATARADSPKIDIGLTQQLSLLKGNPQGFTAVPVIWTDERAFRRNHSNGFLFCLGGVINTQYQVIQGFSGTNSLLVNLTALLNLYWVVHISLDLPWMLLNGTPDPALPAIGADAVFANTGYFSNCGTGVTLTAFLDFGIHHHSDLNALQTGKSRVLDGPNFTSDRSVDDLFGHGTHVAGLWGGNGTEARVPSTPAPSPASLPAPNS